MSTWLNNIYHKLLLCARFGNKARMSFNLDDQKSDRWTNRSREAVSLFVQCFPTKDVKLNVADLGCGDMKIKDMLLEEGYQALSYKGFDCLPQSDEVIRIDFNEQDLQDHYEVIICMGILEYLNNVPLFIAKLKNWADYVILSYVASDEKKYSAQDIKLRGWRNHFSSLELEECFRNTQFVIKQKKILDRGVTMLYLIKT